MSLRHEEHTDISKHVLVLQSYIQAFYISAILKTTKLPAPARDSKRGRDSGGKNVNGVQCHRAGKLGATIHIYFHIWCNLNTLMAARCSNWNSLFDIWSFMMPRERIINICTGVKACDQSETRRRLGINAEWMYLLQNPWTWWMVNQSIVGQFLRYEPNFW